MSIEKREPPEPDILCNTAEQGPLSFEMMELVDRDRIAQPMSDQAELMDSLRDARNNLPEETRTAFWMPGSRLSFGLSLFGDGEQLRKKLSTK
jgi:hypothetical protein